MAMSEDSTLIDSDLLLAQAPWVRTLAHSLVRDPNGADDVMQETMLAALVSPPRYGENVRQLRAWLGRVAFNLARRVSRGNTRRRHREAQVARDETDASTVDDVAKSSVMNQVLEAVGRLEEPYRATVVMRYFQGLSTQDIAERTHSSDNAVRKRLFRARGKLRELLDEVHDGERHVWFQALLPLAGGPSALETGPIRSVPPQGPGGTWFQGVPLATRAAAVFVSITLAAVLFDDPGAGVRIADRPAPDAFASGPEQPRVTTFEGRSPVRAMTGPASEAAAATGGLEAPERERAERFENMPENAEEALSETTAPAAEVAGQVLDLYGLPLAGVAIVASGKDGESREELARSAWNGTFRFDQPAAWSTASERPRRLVAHDFGLRTILAANLSAGTAGLGDLRIVVAPTIQLAGRVVDDLGQPVSARLELGLDEAALTVLDRPVALFEQLPHPVHTGADAARVLPPGHFVWEEVPLGPGVFVRIVPLAQGFQRELRLPLPTSSTWDWNVVLPRLDALARVGGHVLFEDGRPAAGAEVRSGSAFARADANGRFELDLTLDDSESGRSLVAYLAGFAPVQADLGVGSEQDLRLVLAGALVETEGVVLGPGGLPLAGMTVALVPVRADGGRGSSTATRYVDGAAPGFGSSVTVTDDQGQFSLRGPRDPLAGPPESGSSRPSWAVEVHDPHTLAAVRRPVPRSGQSLTVHFEGEETRAHVAGIVYDAEGRPIAGAEVGVARLVQTQEVTWRAHGDFVTTDAQGAFALANVPASAELCVRFEDRLTYHPPAELERTGGQLRIPATRYLRFEPHATLVASAFSLVDHQGRALPFAGPDGTEVLARLYRGASLVHGVPPDARALVTLDDEGEETGRFALEAAEGAVTFVE